jgi:hypothetical protein
MWRYIVRRLLWVRRRAADRHQHHLPDLLRDAGDGPATFAGKNPTPEQIAEVKHQFGLDKPVPSSTRCS